MSFLARAAISRPMASRSIAQVSRSFATAAASERPPLRLYGIGGRYATSLYEAAAKSKQLDKVEADLKAVKELADSSAELRGLLQTPILAEDKRIAAIDAVLDRIGAASATKQFFRLLTENRRTPKLDVITTAYLKLMSASRNEIQGEVTSAKVLSPEELDFVSKALKTQWLKADDKLVLTTKVDPSLLGGIRVQLGEIFLDYSKRTATEQLKREMKAAVNEYYDNVRSSLEAQKAAMPRSVFRR